MDKSKMSSPWTCHTNAQSFFFQVVVKQLWKLQLDIFLSIIIIIIIIIIIFLQLYHDNFESC